MPPHNLIVILGPTASGKTALSIRLAKKFGGAIISADSRQVYRGLNLGTGKVTTKEMAGVPHYLLDVASPRGQYSVSRFADDIKTVLKRINPSTPVFLVGGSPFYIKAATESGSFSNVPPNFTLRKRLERKTTPQLFGVLKKENSDWAATIDRANRRRLIRAIEVSSAKKSHPSHMLPPMRILKIGIRVAQPVLYQKINERVDQRLKQGMVAEVARLHHRGLSWTRLDDFGLEYRYISRYLRGQISKQDMTRQLKTAIHHFAKRQMTWWERDQDIQWVTKVGEAQVLVKQFLKT